MDNSFTIGGVYYALDLEKVMEFISNSPKNENEKETTIEQLYVADEETNELMIGSKNTSEVKKNYSETMSQYRYNLVNNLMNLIMIPTTAEDGTLLITEDINKLFMGQRIAFNTLYEMGIIYEVEEEI